MNGNLLPIEVVLELLSDKPMMKLTPLTKGEIQQLHANPKDEDKLIREHCIEPNYSEDEFKFLKTQIYGAIKIALLSISTDSSQQDFKDAAVKSLTEDDKKKVINQSVT